MNYPEFFDKIPKIKLKDNLSSFLGAFTDGEVVFSYKDIVKSAGHSCPTVLGAYLMTYKALEELYVNESPIRGEIKIEFSSKQSDGVTGVISTVMSNITGATYDTGFKGLAGNFDRRHLMFFEKDISSNARFTRLDTKNSVDVFYDASSINMSEELQSLMQKCLSKKANEEEIKEFGKLWQKRVEEISNKIDEVISVVKI
jgi:formylmethanofuran dehydrogenase subunit E|tara:strand:+ start:330 stop:929 length:600 start_codon:yes stop_codon:yes gene_type:complete